MMAFLLGTAKPHMKKMRVKEFLSALVVALSAIATVEAVLFNDTIAAAVVPRGHAAWLYPANLEQVTEWRSNLTAYNRAAGAQRAVRVLYVYSMDVSVDNFKPVAGTLLATAARTLRSSIPWITHVAAIIDGYYTADGIDSNGNFNSLSQESLHKLADAYARLYCRISYIDGLHLNLEPYGWQFKDKMLIFIRRLSRNLRDRAFCPKPKFLGFFVGTRQATADLYDALGPNGYAVISGYDLDSPGFGLPETPQNYSNYLLSNLQFVKDNAVAVNGRYSVGLPFAASACEFQLGISIEDPSKTIQGYPMYHPTEPSYIPLAFRVLAQVLGPTASQASSPYLGISMWAFLSRDVRVAGYRHLPKNAFDTPGMMAYLSRNMPLKFVR